MRECIGKKILIPILLLMLIGVVFLLIYPPLTSGRPKWPYIADVGLLRTETKAIIDNTEIGNKREVRITQWPASIRALNPRQVYAGTNHVRVNLSGGGVNASWGILIYPDCRNNVEKQVGIRILQKISDGIFRYETKE